MVCFNANGRSPLVFASMPLEILNIALVLFCLLDTLEGAQVAALSCGRILLTRIEAELTGF